MRILIIEDEPLAQEELARLITNNYPQANILKILDSVNESIEWLSENSADLIFMDIHLADGISFEIFNKVQIDTPIIFTTAYDQYAIRAFDVNSIAYILKPLDQQKLIDAINKYHKSRPSSKEISELLREYGKSKDYKTRITIKTGDNISFINISDAAYFYAEERVTYLVEKSGKKHLIDYTIENLENMLDPKIFFRVSRGCLASISSITNISKHFNSRLKLQLNPEYDKEILISRVRVNDFMKWLEGES